MSRISSTYHYEPLPCGGYDTASTSEDEDGDGEDGEGDDVCNDKGHASDSAVLTLTLVVTMPKI